MFEEDVQSARMEKRRQASQLRLIVSRVDVTRLLVVSLCSKMMEICWFQLKNKQSATYCFNQGSSLMDYLSSKSFFTDVPMCSENQLKSINKHNNGLIVDVSQTECISWSLCGAD